MKMIANREMKYYLFEVDDEKREVTSSGTCIVFSQDTTPGTNQSETGKQILRLDGI
jgi:hypothetical protein